MYLITLYFDEKTNHVLGNYMKKVGKQTGNLYMAEHHVPPHLTVSQIEAKNQDVLLPSFEKMAEDLKRGTVELVSVGMLLPYVMYVTPVYNEYLDMVSKTVYQAFSGIPDTRINRYYKYMSWLPHVTVAKTLSTEQMQKAIDVMQNSFAPMTATIEAIGLSKVNPHEDIVRKELS